MAIDRERSRQCLNAFDFRKLFIEELGWDKFSIKLVKQIDGIAPANPMVDVSGVCAGRLLCQFCGVGGRGEFGQ